LPADKGKLSQRDTAIEETGRGAIPDNLLQPAETGNRSRSEIRTVYALVFFLSFFEDSAKTAPLGRRRARDCELARLYSYTLMQRG